MRVRFKMEGGVAHFPGLSQPFTIDTSELTAGDAEELERLVERAGFFELPEAPAPRRGGADLREYTISVSSPGSDRTVRLAEPIEDQHALALVDFLRAKSRELRAGSRDTS